jgi:hypothetical protein
MGKLWLAALLAAAAATPAYAGAKLNETSAGYTYYYKPGATLDAHDIDVAACRRLAATTYQPPPHTTVVAQGGIYGAIGVAIGEAIVSGIQNHRGHLVNIENCMVVKGWRVVVLDQAEGQALAEGDKKTRTEKVRAWIGAETPHGAIVRTFDNDALDRGTVMFLAANPAGKPLSTDANVKIAPPPKPVADTEADLNAPEKPRIKPLKPLKPEELGGVPDGTGLIVVNVSGIGDNSLFFQRLGPNADTPAAVDGKAGGFVVSQPVKAFAKAGVSTGMTVVYAVPPGRWRLAAMSAGEFSVDFCMGAPSFPVAAGDVVFAGSFDMASKTLTPDMSPDAAKGLFPGLSTLPDKLRAAEWTNGSTGVCGGVYIYALEFPARPFADGYHMGSLAVSASMATAPVAPAAQAAASPAAVSAAAPSPPATPVAAPAPTQPDAPPKPAAGV